MIELNIVDENTALKSVILGTASSNGGVPSTAEAYDPKSLESINNGTYPAEDALSLEMKGFETILRKYNVEVLRPDELQNVHQVYARDIGFVIENKFVVSNIVGERAQEISGINTILHTISESHIVRPGEEVRIEGGDVMPWDSKIFVGFSKTDDFEKYKVSRTNEAGVNFLRATFKNHEIIPFELVKSDTDPRVNALHLDCCFQPIGSGDVILYRNGFKSQSDVDLIVSRFGEQRIIEIDQEQMYNMAPNVFSITPKVIVSEVQFKRLNKELTSRGYHVEAIRYGEISKMGGLFRCSTLPLNRVNE